MHDYKRVRVKGYDLPHVPAPVGEEGASCHKGKLSHQHYLLNLLGKSSIMSSVLQPMLKVGQGIPSRSHCAARKTDTAKCLFSPSSMSLLSHMKNCVVSI